MKHFLLWLVMGTGLSAIRADAQDIYVSRDAQISFFSSAPIEDISAKSEQAVSAINLTTRSIYFKVKITSFRFPNGLMQEHFNEDYLESDKYPYAEFTGTILGDADLHQPGTYPVTVQGDLNLHHVTRPYTIQGTLVVSAGGVTASSSFNVTLADHHIKIPTIVTRHIAETVKVSLAASYHPHTPDKPN